MDLAIFKERRAAALARMGEGALVLFAAKEMVRNNDVEHPFRQDSDFYYLSGIEDPGAVLLLASGDTPKFVVFVAEADPARLAWDGPKLTLAQAKEVYGATETYPIAQLSTKLGELLKGQRRVFCSLGKSEQDDKCLIAAVKRAKALSRRNGHGPNQIVDLEDVVHELRRLKHPEELALMRRANEISQRAHLKAMATAAPGRYEYEIRAVLEHEFLLAGSPRPAYESIVGSGPNATTLHYIKNRRQMQDGDLLLIDAGCEFEYYASDITRTFPVNGTFTPPQRRVYEIVLEAQLAAIAAVKPGATFSDLHSISLRILTQGLIDLGLISGPVEEAIEEKRHQPFFMHKTGHYLGMDVHDVGAYRDASGPRHFEPGVVVTVEPGLYIAADNRDVPAEYRGIGVRIEDDVLVTEAGYENLSAGLAKTVDEIEYACRA
jgi:Xaa-Pro aminopeptidase